MRRELKNSLLPLELDVWVRKRFGFQSSGETQVESFDIPARSNPESEREGEKVSSKRWVCFELNREQLLLFLLVSKLLCRGIRSIQEGEKKLS